MKAAPALNVLWWDGTMVGKVVTPGPTEFAYVPSWLETGMDLSPLAVPFGPALYRNRNAHFDHLPGFLADCLPDQWGRRIMERDFSARGIKPTPLNMLAWVGDRGIGALRFEPEMGLDEISTHWKPVAPLVLAREAQAVLRKESPEAYRHLQGAGTAGGAFPKANVALLPDGTLLCGGDVARALPDYPDARLGILKIDCEDDFARPSTDGRMEYAYMEMAKSAGVRTARCEVRSETDASRSRFHLFVDRFDVIQSSAERRHVVTLAGLLESFDLTYRHLLEATRRLTQDRRELMEAVRRMIFNVRAGNADDHGKNHSFIFDATKQKWMLSPAYDLTLNYSAENAFNGLFPSTFGPTPRLSAMRELASEFGVKDDEFDREDRAVAEIIERWGEFAKMAGLSGDDTCRAALIHRDLVDVLASTGRPKKTSRRRRIV